MEGVVESAVLHVVSSVFINAMWLNKQFLVLTL